MRYYFEGVTNTGNVVKGVETARNRRELHHRLHNQDIHVLLSKIHINVWNRQKVEEKSFLFWVFHLQVLLDSGYLIDEALDTYHGEASFLLKDRLLKDVRKGKSFSQALERLQDVDPLFIQCCKMGEEQGRLSKAMAHYLTYKEHEKKFQQTLEKTLSYPFFLFIMILILVFFLGELFEEDLLSFDLTLPGSFYILKQARYVLPGMFGFGVLFFMVHKILKKASSQYLYHATKQTRKVPFFGDMGFYFTLSYFSKRVSFLLKEGVNLMQILEKESEGKDVLSFILKNHVLPKLRTGWSLYKAFASTSFFPALWLSMWEKGEQTGTLSHLLDKSSDFFFFAGKEKQDKILILLKPAVLCVCFALLLMCVHGYLMPFYAFFTTDSAL